MGMGLMGVEDGRWKTEDRLDGDGRWMWIDCG